MYQILQNADIQVNISKILVSIHVFADSKDCIL